MLPPHPRALSTYAGHAYLSPESTACNGQSAASSPDWHALPAEQYRRYAQYVHGGGSSVAATASGSAAAIAPRSYYRFENAADPTIDSAGTLPLQLQAAGPNVSTPIARTFEQGGQVGSYVQFHSTDLYSAWAANASQLPVQCVPNEPVSHCVAGSPKCACKDPHDPLQTTGLTIELLLRAGPHLKLGSNTTLLATANHPFCAFGSVTWVDLSRHGVSFRQLSGERDNPRWFEIRALSNGTGRASTDYLFDGEWHHLVFRRDAGGSGGAGSGKIDIWIDGAVPVSLEKKWASEGEPTWREAASGSE